MVAKASAGLLLYVERSDATSVNHRDTGSAGIDVLPVQHERGVEESIRWEGAGSGRAVLTNRYGQVIYQVEEGGAAFEGIVPAGLYTLTVTGNQAGAQARDHRPLLVSVEENGLGRVREFRWLAGETEPPARGGAPSFVARTWRGAT